MECIAPHIYRWSAPHPEWRPLAEEVVSYAVVDGDAVALVDPLLPAEDDPRRAAVLADIDGWAARAARLELLVSIPYHARSVEPLYERYSDALPTRIWGHANLRRRLRRETPLHPVPRGSAGSAARIAGGTALAYTIGKPRRSEHPLFFPREKAVAFGDAVVGTAGGVRFWNLSGGTGPDWYREVFAPTLRPLTKQDVDLVLVTHGPAILSGGRRALEECLAAPPVDMY